ncbi:hypothetical protein LCGC14_2672750, partial [marine sediment metagenome]
MTDDIGRGGILLLGPTGSGKTPLGELLERDGLWARRCHHFDFGRQLRRIVAAGGGGGFTEQDMSVLRRVLRTGALLEDEHFHIAEKILRAFIESRNPGADDLIVLNGLPRHAGQARDIKAIVAIGSVVHLSCTPEV